jgi:uncharacterized protein VirK/YbjX
MYNRHIYLFKSMEAGGLLETIFTPGIPLCPYPVVENTDLWRDLSGRPEQLEPGLKWPGNKYLLRGLTHPFLTDAWFELLSHTPLRHLYHRDPLLLIKLQRPYLHRRLDIYDRWEVVREHYRFMLSTWTEAEIRLFGRPAGIKVLSLAPMKAAALSVRIFRHARYSREGELTIGLWDEERRLSYANLTFSVLRGATGGREFFIGGLQANSGTDERERIVSITRQMHGLRPKAFLVWVLQQMARAWQVQRIQAVRQENHAYLSYGFFKKKSGIAADYNAFWEECGGEGEQDSDYLLPLESPPRDLTEMNPTKRKMYRMRYAMLEELSGEILRNTPGS